MGVALITPEEGVRLPKAQREFLFGYFTGRGKDDVVRKYLEDDWYADGKGSNVWPLRPYQSSELDEGEADTMPNLCWSDSARNYTEIC